MAGCDAVTAAFAAIAETEHLLFIRGLIPHMLARPLLTGSSLGRAERTRRCGTSHDEPATGVNIGGSQCITVCGRPIAGQQCPAGQTGSATPGRG